jgi:hypothetical protein
MKYFFLLFTIFLSGCFITPQEASKLTSLDLCERYYFGSGADRSKRVIYDEVVRRGIDCNQFKDILIARQTSRNAGNATAVQGLLGTSILINSTSPRIVENNNTVIIKEKPLPPVNIQVPNTIR